jgi:hypothetical protein
MKTIFIIFPLFFLSCAGIYAAMIGANDIIVFDIPPHQAYHVVSVVFGQDEYINDAIREMKIKAKKLHCDAIILKPEEKQTRAAPQANGDNNQIVQVNQTQNQNMNINIYSATSNSKIIIQAQAIRFKE